MYNLFICPFIKYIIDLSFVHNIQLHKDTKIRDSVDLKQLNLAPLQSCQMQAGQRVYIAELSIVKYAT